MGLMYDATCYRYSFVTRVKVGLISASLSYHDLELEIECQIFELKEKVMNARDNECSLKMIVNFSVVILYLC